MAARTEDLDKKACCADTTTSRYSDILRLIPKEVRLRNFGCGCPIPQEDLTGLRIVDLGSGAGLDCFIAARLVGEKGWVQGIDMTEEQLAVAVHKGNVYIDLSGWSPKYFRPVLVQYATSLLQDRVLFGSDYPALQPDRWLKDFETLEVQPEVRQKILLDNARKLLKL